MQYCCSQGSWGTLVPLGWNGATCDRRGRGHASQDGHIHKAFTRIIHVLFSFSILRTWIVSKKMGIAGRAPALDTRGGCYTVGLRGYEGKPGGRDAAARL